MTARTEDFRSGERNGRKGGGYTQERAVEERKESLAATGSQQRPHRMTVRQTDRTPTKVTKTHITHTHTHTQGPEQRGCRLAPADSAEGWVTD